MNCLTFLLSRNSYWQFRLSCNNRSSIIDNLFFLNTWFLWFDWQLIENNPTEKWRGLFRTCTVHAVKAPLWSVGRTMICSELIQHQPTHNRLPCWLILLIGNQKCVLTRWYAKMMPTFPTHFVRISHKLHVRNFPLIDIFLSENQRSWPIRAMFLNQFFSNQFLFVF
jgi:hypothetical protein